MKNKYLIYTLFFIFFNHSLLSANDFIIDASEINVLDKGNITEAKNGVKITSNDNLEIISDKLIYDKKKSLLKLFGNVKISDLKNNIISEGSEYIYNKEKEIIKSIGKTVSIIKDKYILYSDDLEYNRKLSLIFSDKKSKIQDLNNNNFTADKFSLDINKDFIKAKNLSLSDNKNNKYYLNFAVYDLKKNEFLGSDIFIDFEDSLFGNNLNDPRLSANSMVSENNESKVYKGSFTTCNKKKDDKCPPWAIYADEITHKKKEKRLEYKNAWLKIYDKPVLYFPYFFHPDPTVKRQSGFLMPTFQNSNNAGTSLQVPYYKVLSESKDMTLYPRIFFDNEILIQSEYRQANKNSDFILDFSINKSNNKTKNHFFADINSNKQNKAIDIHLETVSNDLYLKENNMTSAINNDNSLLYSYLNYNSFSLDSSLDVSFEIFEDLEKNKTDRYEYVFPNLNYTKYINNELNLNSHGYYKIYDTNSKENILINDLKYQTLFSNNPLLNGLRTNYTFVFKNINSNSENSENFKENENVELLSSILFDGNIPLKKETQKYNNLLTPKFSLRYSPNSTKNNSNLNKKINYDSIFSIDRVDNSAVEGGESITLGIDYSSSNKNNEVIIKSSLANIIRLNENEDLPQIHGLSEKRSDLIGKFEIIPSKFFDLSYEYSIDKDLNHSNYDLIKTNLSLNNFVTSFEFLEEDNKLNQNSYLANSSKYNFNNNYSIKFETSKNLDKNITDYYNLIYEYENDCLTAAIEYNKNYYTDGTMKPEENFLFSIKIIPFGKINSPSIAK